MEGNLFFNKANLQYLWTDKNEASLPKSISGETRVKLTCLSKARSDLCQDVPGVNGTPALEEQSQPLDWQGSPHLQNQIFKGFYVQDIWKQFCVLSFIKCKYGHAVHTLLKLDFFSLMMCFGCSSMSPLFSCLLFSTLFFSLMLSI